MHQPRHQERRYCARHRLELPVYIRYRKRRFLGAQARNISVDGMYLAVKSLTLPTGTPVELEFNHLGKKLLIPALVIHGNSGGIGVMFREPQVALFEEILQGMSAAGLERPPQPSADNTTEGLPGR
jgi:hypothetical protein